MIYTVTFNPALDYVIAVDHFAPGQINRTKEETMVCGGKGINVSALLANLGYESTALGFVAGFTGEEIVRRCQKAGFHSDFIRVKDGLSRINVKMKSNEETEINGMGPDITGKNVELLFEQLNELKAGDVLVLSGSIQSNAFLLQQFCNSHHLLPLFFIQLREQFHNFFPAADSMGKGSRSSAGRAKL